MVKYAVGVSFVVIATSGMFVSPAVAQSIAQSAKLNSDEIIVTARKRNETSIAAPVVLTAVSAEELDRRAINNLDAVARMVPQLIIGQAGSSVQGGTIAIRGISGPEGNPFGDQAVSFNIDGVQIAKSFVRRMSETDLSQIEVLKGPQALFYGKNSPAGIISIRTADPTDRFEAKVSAGYEFEGREYRGEGFVSFPISDSFGFRLSGYYSHLDGYLKDQTPNSSPFNPKYDRLPHSHDFALRGTVKWESGDTFEARLKLNYGQTKNSGPKSTAQYINCSTGVRQSGSLGQCEVGRHVIGANSGPLVGTIPGTLNTFGDGENYQNQKQFLGGFEMNQRLTDEILLTSVTGYYRVKLAQCTNFSTDDRIILPSCNPTRNSEFSQELRVIPACGEFDSRWGFPKR